MSSIIDELARTSGVPANLVALVVVALREPAQVMVDAGIDASLQSDPRADDREVQIWRAMVDRVLDRADANGDPPAAADG